MPNRTYTYGTVAEVFRSFLVLGLTSFGGPIAHLGYFRREFVERRCWVTESQFAQLLAICQFLPGPASSQLGFTIGLLRGGWAGALAACIAFTLPSALILIGFAALLPALSGPIGDAAIHGLKLVACAVVADAVWGMSKKICPDIQRRSIAIVAAAVLLFAGSVWLQLGVVAGGAIAGLLLCSRTLTADSAQIRVTYGKRTGLSLIGLFLLLLVVLGLAAPQDMGLAAVADAFYRAGALVFGGGHVVLPLLEASVVETGWVSSEDFLAGYGASQAIPGPMFAFSAYLGAIIPSPSGGLLTAATALVFMFLPGFLLVTAVLPLWQSVSHNPQAQSAIAGVNAAVVGVLAAALYDPIFTSSVGSGADLAVVMLGFGMLAIWKLSPLIVVLWCVTASVVSVWL